MSEVYRIPPWLMAEYWEMHFTPKNMPDNFRVYIFKDGQAYEGKGVSISHAAKNAYKLRKNASQLPAKGSVSSSKDKT